MANFDEAQLRQEYLDLQKQFEDINIYKRSDYPELAKRQKELADLIDLFDKHQVLQKSLKDAQVLSSDEDQNLANLAKSEVEEINGEIEKINQQINSYFNPDADIEKRNCILEIRAGVGGSEASLFAADLYRMYIKFAEKQKWRTELINQNPSDAGGFKEIITEITGRNAYKLLKHESGVHRVQRIPTTESQGRIHTSTVSVAIMPKIEEAELDIPASDIRVDTYRSSGPGGQSVNTTDSAVRVTHLPTGIIITCQDGKSQFKNKERAMNVLRTRLNQKHIEDQTKQASEERKQLIGQALRTEKIRTYNFPQDRLTDHRINLSLNNLSDILNGNLQTLVDKLQDHDF